jgi:hypothetical protein
MEINWAIYSAIFAKWEDENVLDQNPELAHLRQSEELASQLAETFSDENAKDPEAYAFLAAIGTLADQADLTDKVLLDGLNHGIQTFLKSQPNNDLFRILDYRLGILCQNDVYSAVEGTLMLQGAWLGEFDVLPAGALALKNTQNAAWRDQDGTFNPENLANLFIATTETSALGDADKLEAFSRACWLLQAFECYPASYLFRRFVVFSTMH